MKKIYIAGAYSDDNVISVLKNIGRGEYWAAKLFKAGYAPFTPWHDKDFVIKNWNKELEVELFYNYSLEWLSVSDALFVVPNEDGLRDWKDSTGTVKEIQFAKDNGIPIYFSLKALLTNC